MQLSHFTVSLLFALFCSVLLGIVSKRSDRERVRYAVYCFSCFLLALFGIGWFMRVLHG